MAVAEAGSFTEAARLLHMTQPAVSWQIKALEEQLGLQLLERTERGVRLTAAGEAIYEESREILRRYERLQELAGAWRGLKAGRVLLAASTIPGEYLCPHWIGTFRRLYPGIEVHLAIGDTQEVVELLLERRADLGIVGAPSPSPRLNLEPLWQDEIVLLIGPQQRELPEPLPLRELRSLPLILREEGSGTRRVVAAKLAEQGIALEELSVALELGSTRAVITAVEAGLGAGFASRLAAEEGIALGRLRAVPVERLDLHRYLYLATLRECTLSLAAQALVDFLRSQRAGAD